MVEGDVRGDVASDLGVRGRLIISSLLVVATLVAPIVVVLVLFVPVLLVVRMGLF